MAPFTQTVVLLFVVSLARSVDGESRHVVMTGDCNGFTSHRNFPESYPVRTRNSWNISVTPGQTIELFFDEMDVSRHGDYVCGYPICKCDYVKVYDAAAPIRGREIRTRRGWKRFCGSKHGDETRTFTSTGSHLFVEFFSNSDGNLGSGFKAEYRSNNYDYANPQPGAPARCQPCGRPEISPRYIPSKIVGGVEATANSLPWQVGLTSSYMGGPFCGGSLVGEEWVVTAAHCLQGTTASNVYVNLGAHSLWDTSGTVSIQAAELILHPNYNGGTLENDYAVIRLSSAVTFGSTISPICLPEPGDALPVHEEVLVSGWGTLTSGGDSPSVLMQARMDVLTQDQCDGYLSGYATSVMMCAADIVNGNIVWGKDTCQGDSGGPLVWQNNRGSWTLIGITSWGYGCGDSDSPGVYALVTAGRVWMDSVMNP